MMGTEHRCLVTNHRIHAPCGVEIEIEGETVYVLQVLDGKPVRTGESFDLGQIPYAKSSTGYLQICNHCLQALNSKKDKMTPKNAKIQQEEPHSEKISNVEDCMLSFSEDCTFDELLLFMMDNYVATDSEIAGDKIIYAEQKRKAAVAAPRELGDWIEVEIDAVNRRVTCNGEEYIFGAYSAECALFEVMQFGKHPPTHCKDTSEKWTDIRLKCLKVMLEAMKQRDT